MYARTVTAKKTGAAVIDAATVAAVLDTIAGNLRAKRRREAAAAAEAEARRIATARAWGLVL